MQSPKTSHARRERVCSVLGRHFGVIRQFGSERHSACVVESRPRRLQLSADIDRRDAPQRQRTPDFPIAILGWVGRDGLEIGLRFIRRPLTQTGEIQRMPEAATTCSDSDIINLTLRRDEVETLLHDVNNRVVVARSDRASKLGFAMSESVPECRWESMRTKLIEALNE